MCVCVRMDITHKLNIQTQICTDVNELHQHWLQVTEGGSGLHTETQLLLEVPTKRNLNTVTDKQTEHQCKKTQSSSFTQQLCYTKFTFMTFNVLSLDWGIV